MAPLVALAALLLACSPPLRHAAEAHMAVHMVLHLPAVALLGALAARALPAWLGRRYAQVDAMGLGSLTYAVLVLMFWMIPVALDASLLWPAMALAKYTSVALAGAALRGAWRRAPPTLLLFMLGNLAWMLATAGLLIQQSNSRLCVSYLAEQQGATGAGLLAWSLVVGGCAFGRWLCAEPC